MDTPLSGKKAVVIGGTGGLGRAIADGLVASGAQVCRIGAHSLDQATLVVDLDSASGRREAIDACRDADILCVARGPFLRKPLAETTEADWETIVYSNLVFPGILVSAVLPHMVEKGWGRILLLGGTRTDVVRGFRTNAAYAAAKTGLSSLVKSVALEYAPRGITCNAICPGFVDTEYMDDGEKEEQARKIPDGKLISVAEIADSALFLLEKSVYNGTILPVDKGWTPALI